MKDQSFSGKVKWIPGYIGAWVPLFIIPIIIIYILYYRAGFAPFGNLSLACEDGYWQYMDFFAWYKRVLEGKDSIVFSMSTGLGMPDIALFSYYLASPWNLLIVFFKNEQLHSFFDMIVALKVAAASLTFGIFLHRRFAGRIDRWIVFLLSMSYAFMQYSFAQATCTMWLDGVYMLPLILLGVYRLVEEGRGAPLAIPVALAVIFNWYTAGIDCIFSILWFLYELYLREQADQSRTAIKDRNDGTLPGSIARSHRTWLSTSLHYIYSMTAGVMISAFIFFPTVYITMRATRGNADMSAFRNEFLGNIFSVIPGYSLGAVSSMGSVSVFAGGFVLMGLFLFMYSKKIPVKIKAATVILLIVELMSCYWRPLFGLFSLLQRADSYWYRFSYIICFTLIFIAGYYFAAVRITTNPNGAEGNGDLEDDKETRTGVVRLTAVYLIALFAVDHVADDAQDWRLYYTALFQLVITGAYLILTVKKKACSVKLFNGVVRDRLLITAVCLATVAELAYNALLLMNLYCDLTDVQTFAAYETEQQELIATIKESDKGLYRITQTSSRPGWVNQLANLDEAMAFGYWDIGSYVSSPIASQMVFLNKAGYTVYMDRLVEKAMVLLPIDSLLGVKYILSPYAYEYCDIRSDLGAGNGKAVYENRYCMPMAFRTDLARDYDTGAVNAFSYQNDLLKTLFSSEEELFIPVEHTVTDQEHERHYDICIPFGRYALYGNIPYTTLVNAWMDINGRVSICYASINSMTNFHVPTPEGADSAYVALSIDDKSILGDEYFYLLDLDVLENMSQKAQAEAARELEITNGRMSCVIEGKGGDALFTSIPYATGWRVCRNGEHVDPYTIDGSLMLVPLVQGTNEITMEYHIPFILIYILVSVAGVLMVIGEMLFTRSKRRIPERKKLHKI